MRAAVLVVAGIICLCAAAPLWAGPFTGVPTDHWSYRACARLIQLHVIPAESGADFSGQTDLTRFEFGLALHPPLAEVAQTLANLPAGSDRGARLRATLAALRLSPRASERELAGALRDLRRLAAEYRDVLDSSSLNAEWVGREIGSLEDEGDIRDWRLRELAVAPAAQALRPYAEVAPSPARALEVPVARGLVGVSVSNPEPPSQLLNYLATSAAATRPTFDAVPGSAEPALSDPRFSRLRTSYEYGLGSALTLSLAYEEIARTGQGKEALDAASLTSLGVGYRLTPSTSVKLSYTLLEYANYALATPPLRDRLAETAVSIAF